MLNKRDWESIVPVKNDKFKSALGNTEEIPKQAEARSHVCLN